MKYAAVIVGLILFAILALVWVRNCDRDQIDGWVKDNGHTLQSVEYRMMSRGPYTWSGKNTRVYMVTVENGAVYWFRFGNLFRGMEVEQENKDF